MHGQHGANQPAGTCPLLILIQEYIMYKEMTMAPVAMHDLGTTTRYKSMLTSGMHMCNDILP